MINMNGVGVKNNSYQVSVSEVAFGSSEIKIKGRVFMPAIDGSMPGIVLCHGFGTDLRTVEASARIIAGKGIAVLVFDFRGHGESGGIADENLVNDVIDAWNFLLSYPGINRKRVGLAGHSMGAMAAILAARQVKPRALIALSCPPEFDCDFSRISSEMPFELIKEDKEVREYPRDGSLPWVKGIASIISRLWMRMAGYKVRVNWSRFFQIFSGAKLTTAIKDLRDDCSMLFVHCMGDNIAPYSTAVELYEMAQGSKTLLLSAGGFHSTPLLAGRLRRDWTEWTANALRSI